MVGQGFGRIGLDWSAPPKGVGTGFGGVKYYNVERKRTDEDDWELISSAARTEITLKDQEPGFACAHQGYISPFIKARRTPSWMPAKRLWWTLSWIVVNLTPISVPSFTSTPQVHWDRKRPWICCLWAVGPKSLSKD